MSIRAGIYLLFRNSPTEETLSAIAGAIENRTMESIGRPLDEWFDEVWDADTQFTVDEDGSLRSVNFSAKPLNSLNLQGRLYRCGCLTRYWSKEYREGPGIYYVTLFLTLLIQPEIEGVWYGYGDDEFRHMPPMTRSSVIQLLEDYIELGRG